MFDRLAIYGVPLAAGIVTAAVLLGPGSEQPAVGVRVRGLVAVGATHTALQLGAVSHRAGAYAPAKLTSVTLTLWQDGRAIGRWRGDTGEDGFAEALLALEPPARAGSLRLTVDGPISAAADIAVAAPLSEAPPSAPIAVSADLGVTLPRGFAVAEHPEPFLVQLDAGTTPPALELEAEGGAVALGEPARACDDGRCRYRWRAQVTPRALSTTLVLRVDGSERWQGVLPLARGLWLDPAIDGTLRIASAGAAEHAHVALFDRGGRVWAARRAMTVDDAGRAHAEVALPELPLDGPVSVMLSSDPDAALSIRWPLHPERGQVLGDAAPLFDSVPQAIAREAERAFRARLPALWLIAAAAAFELLYLWRLRRESDAELSRLQARARSGALRLRTPLWWATLAIGSLVLAFGVLALMTLV